MSSFENQQTQATMIARQIEGKLAVLGVDWKDDSALRLIAREAIAWRGTRKAPGFDPMHPDAHIKMEVYGLVALMLRAMEEGADEGRLIHGGDMWKAFAKALWTEKKLAEG